MPASTRPLGWSAGAERWKQFCFDPIIVISLQVYKSESSKHYLFVKPGGSNAVSNTASMGTWAIYSSLNGEKRYLRSASSGQPCPAHKSNSKNEEENLTAWLVNKLKEKGREHWKETTTEILVSCETHDCNNQCVCQPVCLCPSAQTMR